MQILTEIFTFFKNVQFLEHLVYFLTPCTKIKNNLKIYYYLLFIFMFLSEFVKDFTILIFVLIKHVVIVSSPKRKYFLPIFVLKTNLNQYTFIIIANFNWNLCICYNFSFSATSHPVFHIKIKKKLKFLNYFYLFSCSSQNSSKISQFWFLY